MTLTLLYRGLSGRFCVRTPRTVAGALAALLVGGCATLPLVSQVDGDPPATRPATAPTAASPIGQKPDIILILADDMGYSDVGCFGGEIKTPNIDSIAAEGVRFTQFYNTPRCCPTRASLLTGVYPHQAGVGAMNQDLGAPGYVGHLTDRVATIAEILKDGGYHTGMVGKWHLSNLQISSGRPDAKELLNRQKQGPISSPEARQTWPDKRGFERFTGTIPGVENFFDPYGLIKDGKPYTPENLGNFYNTDFINDTASEFIRDFAKEDTPYFLYVAHVAPHWPLQAKEADIAKYRDTYTKGWEAVRAQRYRRQLEMKLIDDKWPLSPQFVRDGRNTPLEFASTQREWEARRMAVFAAQVDSLDQGIGRILQTLRDTGRMDRTLLVFMSDNGACAEVVQAGWYDVQTRQRDGQPIRVGNNPGVMPGPQSTWQSYGPEWANLSNTPFRRFKHDTNEGGISAPFIIHWPSGIKQHGTMIRDVAQLIDLMPTFLAAAGVEHPKQYHGHDILPMEGKSLWPLLAGKPLADRGALFWEHEGHRGVRDGKWKMVCGSSTGVWELYDLDADRTELHDLAGKMPEKVKELDAEYKAWADRAYVKTWPVE